MEEGWVKIFSGDDLMQVKLAEDVLKQNGIESHIINKRDSAFNTFGTIDLLTPPDKAEAALQVLKDNDIKQ